MSDDGYPSADEIASLANLEMDVFGGKGGKTAKEMAQNVFQRNAVDAAMTICSMAKHASSETVRLRAAQHVLDRAMGTVAAVPVGGDKEEDPLVLALNEFNSAVAADKRAGGAG